MRLRPALALPLDAALVLTFATVGRASHEHGLSLAGVAETAWPFLLGAGIGWLVVRASRDMWPVTPSGGLTVWFATLVIGMLLRYLTGGGVQLSFVLVAGTFLLITLVGWRVLATRVRRGSARVASR